MKLTVKEQERLIMFNVAEVSRRRWKRGVKLNYIEAMSIICDELLERAREGRDSIYDLVELGSRIITEEDVMEGTPEMLPVIYFRISEYCIITPENSLLETAWKKILLLREDVYCAIQLYCCYQ